MTEYGVCRNCGEHCPLVTLGSLIGPTRLCSLCVSLIRDWCHHENLSFETPQDAKCELIGRRQLSVDRFAGCPSEISDYLDTLGDDG